MKKINFKNFLQLNRFIFNQDGQGLVSVLIAAALLVVIAIAVGSFLNGYNTQSVHLESSTECQNVAKTIVEYIKKDEASLTIYSNGPTATGNFPTSGVGQTADGIEMYGFMPAPIPVYTTTNVNSILTGGASQIPMPSTPPLTNNWNFYNYLSIKNSVNRLVALAETGRCCSVLKACSTPLATTTGAPNFNYYISGQPGNPPSLNFAEANRAGAPINIRAKVAINLMENGASLCNGNTLTRLPDIRQTITSEFNVGVTINENTPNAHYCEATGSVQQSVDNVAPYTVLQVKNTLGSGAQLCDTPGTKKGNPSVCQADTILIDVKTYADTTAFAGGSCKNFLKNGRFSATCVAGGPSQSVFGDSESPDPANGNTPSCTPSDPGSIFLCRIGEQAWFMGSASSATQQWAPCEKAKVYNNAGIAIVGATVGITYANQGTTGAPTARTTLATISLRGVPEGAYMVDARAVDTQGRWVGPSFCSIAGSCSSPTNLCAGGANSGLFCASAAECPGGACNVAPMLNICRGGTNNNRSCATAANCPGGTCSPDPGVTPMFVVNTTNPQFLTTPLPRGGSIDTATNISNGAAPATAMAAFPGYYQCNANNGGSFQSYIRYAYYAACPTCAPLGLGGTCTGLETKPAPAGTQTFGPTSYSTGDVCALTGFGAAAGDPSGTYSVKLNYTNECGHAAAVAGSTQSWCYDNIPNYSVTMGQSNTNTPIPILQATSVPNKVCGLTMALPLIHTTNSAWTFTAKPMPAPYSVGIADFATSTDSGCLTAPNTQPGTQFCMQEYDPCGRNQISIATYQTKLALTPTTRTCQSNIAGTPLGGNACVSPVAASSGYCNDSLSCQANAIYLGHACSSDPAGLPADRCVDASDCGGAASVLPGVHGTCNGALYKCVSGAYSSNVAGAPVVGAACTVTNTCTVTAGPGAYKCSSSGVVAATNTGVCAGGSWQINNGVCSTDTLLCGVAHSPCAVLNGTYALRGPGTTGTCSNPTNTLCQKCPGASSSMHLCPTATTCTGVTSVADLPVAACTTPPVPPPPACVTTPTVSACVAGNTTTHYTCSGGCATCPPDVLTPCGNCTWHRGEHEGDQTACHTAGHTPAFGAVCGSTVPPTYCFGDTVTCDMIPVGSPCTCGQIAVCLNFPVHAGSCQGWDMYCTP